ncbi:hypothetical protein ALC53_01742 [Atta colombica]|uniref:Uncharacterized protein n=1 Tax=Atta colombica TaxID=520822 RepID=A0A195BUV5_9HYME|nr:hypothetical protein ALC53_01742 [Atta colombica]
MLFALHKISCNIAELPAHIQTKTLLNLVSNFIREWGRNVPDTLREVDSKRIERPIGSSIETIRKRRRSRDTENVMTEEDEEKEKSRHENEENLVAHEDRKEEEGDRDGKRKSASTDENDLGEAKKRTANPSNPIEYQIIERALCEARLKSITKIMRKIVRYETRLMKPSLKWIEDHSSEGSVELAETRHRPPPWLEIYRG